MIRMLPYDGTEIEFDPGRLFKLMLESGLIVAHSITTVLDSVKLADNFPIVGSDTSITKFLDANWKTF